MDNSFDIENKLSLDFIVNKYVDIEKRLALSEYKRNKDKKKIKRITNDLYEEYEDKTPQEQQMENQQDKTQTQPVDDNFESKLKSIIEDNKDIENEKQDDNQQDNEISPSFKLISKRKNKKQFPPRYK
jgi:hypothetical protein